MVYNLRSYNFFSCYPNFTSFIYYGRFVFVDPAKKTYKKAQPMIMVKLTYLSSSVVVQPAQSSQKQNLVVSSSSQQSKTRIEFYILQCLFVF